MPYGLARLHLVLDVAEFIEPQHKRRLPARRSPAAVSSACARFRQAARRIAEDQHVGIRARAACAANADFVIIRADDAGVMNRRIQPKLPRR